MNESIRRVTEGAIWARIVDWHESDTRGIATTRPQECTGLQESNTALLTDVEFDNDRSPLVQLTENVWIRQ